jgi:hypothetical protein
LAPDQVALSAVHRAKDLRNPRPVNLPALDGQFPAEVFGQRGDLIQIRKPLTIQRFCQLPAAPLGFARLHHQRRQSLSIQAEEGPAAPLETGSAFA